MPPRGTKSVSFLILILIITACVVLHNTSVMLLTQQADTAIQPMPQLAVEQQQADTAILPMQQLAVKQQQADTAKQPQPHCAPKKQRLHKTHSLCTALLPSEPAALACSTHCPSLEALQRLCGVNIHSSMENYGSCVEGDEHNICMSVNSGSDVHMQYFSWQDINFFAQTVPYEDRNEGIMASFVSNCVQWRLDYLTALTSELQGLGQTVHNYGACAHNAEQSDVSSDKYADKKRLSLRHKFLFAFENSETEGYVTEKLFYALSDGAVPVYRGAADVGRYLPSPNAAIVVPPDMSPADLARLLVAEAANATAYQNRLAWKSRTPDARWVAEMDLGVSHSHCRACQRILDMESSPKHPGIRVRERGTSEWVDFAQGAFSDIRQLKQNLSLAFAGPAQEKPRGAGGVVFMYDLWDRNRCPITSMAELPAGTQLEVVMQNPGWRQRFPTNVDFLDNKP